jgi:hypothetical protein
MTDRDDLDTAAFAELLSNTLLQEPGLREPTMRQSMLLALGLDRRVLSGLPLEAPLTVAKACSPVGSRGKVAPGSRWTRRGLGR